MATPIPPNDAPLTAWEVAAASAGVVRAVLGEGRSARGITSDSRAVRRGSAFFALRGEVHDGHGYVDAAVAAGAALVVVERGSGTSPVNVDVVEVKDTLVAWGETARAHLARWRRSRVATDPARTLCITGSAGKTTTKELAAALLAEVGATTFTPGNLNNRIGLPAVAFTITPAHRFAVLEAGMSLPGEIAILAEIARPDVALITNVGLAHAEGVGGTRAHVGREKGALVAALGKSGSAIVNADDGAAMGQLARTHARDVRTFGRAAEATYKLLDRVPLGLGGSRVTIERPCADCVASDGRAREIIEVVLPLVGEVAALDLCGALAAAEAMAGRALDLGEITRGVGRVENVDGRAATVELDDGTVLVDDTYNANPASMRAALGTLSDLAAPGQRIVAVLGEMKELGDGSRDEHEALGAVVAAAGVRLLVTCGGLATLIAERAAECGVTVEIAKDADDAAARAARLVKAGDVVLVKGSRSVRTENVVRALVEKRGRREAP